MRNNFNENTDSVRSLITRQIKSHANDFVLELTTNNFENFFEVESCNNKIIIRGNTNGNIATGFYWYLKNYCNVHISWSSNEIHLPNKLIMLDEKIKINTDMDLRYYFNFCTFSYSTAFWGWRRWEKEIDIMAMYGINMPLSMVGHEYVWMNIANRIGLSESDVLSFLTGPSFSAWNNMGNIDGIGGPLTKEWILEHYELQKKIISRMRSLGMKIVLPGFFGHVPKEITKIFPNARITQLEKWFGAEGTWFLEPTDLAYAKIASIFYEIQEDLYGNDHYYAMDLFHEGNAPNTNQTYLVKTAKSVINTLKKHDPLATWVMQSWSMDKSIIEAIPDKNLIILDLNAEESPKWIESDAFYGKPWIWCMLHNYGGRNGMNGNIKEINENLNYALKSDKKGNLSGIGFAPEAIEENPIFYELIAEKVWRNDSLNVDHWVENYILRRYGKLNQNTKMAWKILLNSVYSGNNSFGATDSIICARPDFEIDKVAVSGVDSYYSISDVMKAYSYMLESVEELKDNKGFKYDLIDVGRESLAMAARPIYLKMMKEFRESNKKNFDEYCNLLKTIIEGLNNLVGTHKDFLLGKYINQAKSWGKNPTEKKKYSENLKMQITIWWPSVSFMDYANKHWEGLISNYYLKRWELFVEYLQNSFDKSMNFDKNEYIYEIEKLEMNFVKSDVQYREIEFENFTEQVYYVKEVLYPKINMVLADEI